MTVTERRHVAWPGVRIARWCSECHRREFGDPKWVCPQHPGKTITQPNKPYFGQSTEAKK